MNAEGPGRYSSVTFGFKSDNAKLTYKGTKLDLSKASEELNIVGKDGKVTTIKGFKADDGTFFELKKGRTKGEQSGSRIVVHGTDEQLKKWKFTANQGAMTKMRFNNMSYSADKGAIDTALKSKTGAVYDFSSMKSIDKFIETHKLKPKVGVKKEDGPIRPDRSAKCELIHKRLSETNLREDEIKKFKSLLAVSSDDDVDRFYSASGSKDESWEKSEQEKFVGVAAEFLGRLQKLNPGHQKIVGDYLDNPENEGFREAARKVWNPQDIEIEDGLEVTSGSPEEQFTKLVSDLDERLDKLGTKEGVKPIRSKLDNLRESLASLPSDMDGLLKEALFQSAVNHLKNSVVESVQQLESGTPKNAWANSADELDKDVLSRASGGIGYDDLNKEFLAIDCKANQLPEQNEGEDLLAYLKRNWASPQESKELFENLTSGIVQSRVLEVIDEREGGLDSNASLELLGRESERVPGDGNCFFHALAQQDGKDRSLEEANEQRKLLREKFASLTPEQANKLYPKGELCQAWAALRDLEEGETDNNRWGWSSHLHLKSLADDNKPYIAVSKGTAFVYIGLDKQEYDLSDEGQRKTVQDLVNQKNAAVIVDDGLNHWEGSKSINK